MAGLNLERHITAKGEKITGQIVCYINRTYRVLPTAAGTQLAQITKFRYNPAMSATLKISSTEFQKDVPRFQEAAQHGPVAITEGGQVRSVLLSASLFELFLKGRIARRIEDIDEDTVRAIAESRMPQGYEHLDNLIKDWKP